MHEKAQGEGFVIRDLRGSKREPGQEKTKRENEEREAGIELNFSTFILSLSSSVMLNFGEIPDPVTGEKEKNLPMAKQTIDILAMLQEKTKGNLTEDEAKLLDNVLADLRLHYVNLLRKG